MSFINKLKNALSSKQLYLIIAAVVIGLVLATHILTFDKPKPESEKTVAASKGGDEIVDTHDHEKLAGEQPKGPHGGKLFSKDGYAVEVTIFEENVEPQFRIYTYQDDKLLAPNQSQLKVVLERLGRPAETISLLPEADYLKGDTVVQEPHSFKVNIQAQHLGNQYVFEYEQQEARVHMNEKQITNNAVEILTAAPARIKMALNLIGEIKLNADKTVYIVPRLAGIVESVSANAGDKVRKGQILAVISSQSLADQRSELLASQKRLSLSRITYEREKKLWEEKISAEQDYLQARNAMQEDEISLQSAQQKLNALGGGKTSGNLTHYEIRSPIDGVIADKQIATGQVVKEDASIFTVADLGSVWAEMTIYAKDLNAVRLGQQVTVKSSALDALEVGIISYVGAVVGEQSRTATARVVLPNAKGLWRPGVPVNIELVAEEVEVPLAVSVEGIQSLRDWKVVFAKYGDEFEARPLKLGRGDDKYVEVLDGLLLGEKYAAGNSFLIKAELGKAGASHDH
ncbi:MAG TPA: efflux RND transporter periplasmic adaptor subunit [Methylophilaceae bacterium]|nr:efflux RND transporter periplasmic adaptor subunit [Methylophilaceae bacterium]